MNIGQIKVVSWTAAGLLTLGLSAYVWSFVSTLEERRSLPDPEVVRATLTGAEPVVVRNDGQVPYADVKRLFHDMNWTGAITKPPEVVVQAPVATTPQVVPVRDLVRVLWVQVDLADPKGSAVFLKYKPRAAVPNTGLGGFLLREGDKLAAPHEHVQVAAIGVDGVTFSFADAGRAKETLLPAEFDAKAQIVQVGPDGVVMPPARKLIPRLEGEPFRPGKTTPLGSNRYVLGSEDMTYAEANYTEILSQDVRLKQHRDPRTGRYDGIEISDVKPGSFAERHGAQEGDVVKSINGHPVSSTQEAIHFVKTNQDHYTTWEVVIENRGKTRTVTYQSPSN